jgi:chaperonin cofactor prefoldin
MDFSPKNLKKHFDALTAKHDKIQEKLQPLRDELDAVVAGEGNITVKQARKKEETLRPKIKALQAELAPIENERAAVAKALGGRSLSGG